MTRAATLFVALIAVAAGSPAAAQDVLTVDRAVQEALAHNPSLRSARAASAEAAARADQADAGRFPAVSASESWQRSNQPVFAFSSLLSARQFAASDFAIDALNHPSALNLFQTSIGVDQVIFDGGRRRASANAAKDGLEAADASAAEAASALIVNVTEAYGRLVAAEAARRSTEAAVASAREDEARARRRRDSGMATDADVLALAAHVADLQQRAIGSEGDAAIGRAELNRLMGAPIDRTYQVELPADTPAPADALPAAGVLIAEADRNRPDLRRIAALERLASASRSEARAAVMPQVAAEAGVQVSGTQFTDRAGAWTAGGSVRWNLSLGGAERAQLKAAAQAETRARAEAEDARAAIHVEVITALSRLQAARARQAAGRAAVDEARESERIVRDRFDAGMAGVNDVLRASTAVLDAETQRVSALVDAMVAGAALDRALGRQPRF